MQTLSTTNQELREFRDWYADHHGTQPTEHSVFTTCICGHFHTYTKAAEAILSEMRKMRLVEVRAGKVTINDKANE